MQMINIVKVCLLRWMMKVVHSADKVVNRARLQVGILIITVKEQQYQ